MPQAAAHTITTNRTLQTAAPRDLNPKDILIDLFVQELHPDAEWLADLVIRRLRDAGFEIRPTETPPPRRP